VVTWFASTYLWCIGKTPPRSHIRTEGCESCGPQGPAVPLGAPGWKDADHD
jgi:hypothetical protein